MLGDGARQLLARVLGVPEGRLGKSRIRKGRAGEIRVDEKRKNRVKVGSRRDLDLSRFAGPFVGRNDLVQDRPARSQDDFLVFLREALAFPDEGAERRVPLAKDRVDPGQVEKDLEVAELG